MSFNLHTRLLLAVQDRTQQECKALLVAKLGD
jgi:hypothetical protein